MKKIILVVISLFILAFGSQAVKAQNAMTLYPIHAVPQSNYSNPGMIPECKWYIGFPMLSSVYADFGSSVAYNDLFVRTQTDSLTLDFDNMISKMPKKSYVNFSMQEELFSFGFRFAKKHYLYFNATQKFNFSFGYPRSLLELAYYGNGPYIDETLDFSGLGINSTLYTEYGAGYAMQYNDKLSFGVRAKFLVGYFNAYTKGSSTASLYTEDISYDLTLNSDFEANACFPSLLTDTLLGEYTTQEMIAKLKDEGFNKGFGFDFGAQYHINDKWTVSASVLDLSWIKWNANPMNVSDKNPDGASSFTFDGMAFNSLFNDFDSVFSSKTDALLDTITETLGFDNDSVAYWAPLTTKIYLSGTYNLTDKDRFGIIARFDIFNGGVHPQATLTYNRKLGQWLDFSASYSFNTTSYFNIGAGLAVNAGPFQVYAVTDNIMGAFIPEKTKIANVHFGINFVFGYKEIINDAKRQ